MVEQNILVIGDRVLLRKSKDEEITPSGLILPESALDNVDTALGIVVKTGPGHLTPGTGSTQEEWYDKTNVEPKFIPLQAQTGDVALYIRKAGIDVKIKEENFVIVPHGAILLLTRDEGIPNIEKFLNGI